MNRSSLNPAGKYLRDAVFYTAFPEYRNGTPEPHYWEPEDFRAVDTEALRSIFSLTPESIIDFLLNEDRLNSYHHICRMAEKYGYDQFDITQGEYKSLAKEMVSEFMGKPELVPVLKNYVEKRMETLNGDVEKAMPRRLMGLYAAELFEKFELGNELIRLQNPRV
ncbi:MAG: hypothetical protein J7K54_00270 [Candidatus Aenigmarchaeota archaeon]|nr:hypothetical protein [Candidatus Aenigmarchaeota archaeon]